MRASNEQTYPTITGVGGCLGDIRLDNNELIARYSLKSTDMSIRRLTGIEQRYHGSEGVLPSQLGAAAARTAIERAEIYAQDIAFLGVSTTMGDHISPTVASKLHGELGLHPKIAGTFDLAAACSGALATYEVACGNMMGFQKPSALVVSTEMLSRSINPDDRRTAILFGDGAGAVVLEQQPGANRPVFATLTETDTDAINVYAGVATGYEGIMDERRFIRMDGKRVRAYAERMMPAVAKLAAQEAGIWNETTDQVDSDSLGLFVPHQANYAMIEPLADMLGVPKEKRVRTVVHQGNTSSASIPLGLNHAYETGQLSRGERSRVLMVAIGAGMVAKAAVLDVNIP